MVNSLGSQTRSIRSNSTIIQVDLFWGWGMKEGYERIPHCGPLSFHSHHPKGTPVAWVIYYISILWKYCFNVVVVLGIIVISSWELLFLILPLIVQPTGCLIIIQLAILPYITSLSSGLLTRLPESICYTNYKIIYLSITLHSYVIEDLLAAQVDSI